MAVEDRRINIKVHLDDSDVPKDAKALIDEVQKTVNKKPINMHRVVTATERENSQRGAIPGSMSSTRKYGDDDFKPSNSIFAPKPDNTNNTLDRIPENVNNASVAVSGFINNLKDLIGVIKGFTGGSNIKINDDAAYNEAISRADAIGNKLNTTQDVEEVKKLEAELLNLVNAINAYENKSNEASQGTNRLNASQTQIVRTQQRMTRSFNISQSSIRNFVRSGLKGLSRLSLLFVGVSSTYNAMMKLGRMFRSFTQEGINNLVQESSELNQAMSSVKGAFETLKNQAGAAAQPLITAFAPALKVLIGYFNQAVVAISKFMALLTGQSYIYKAGDVQADYAKSLDKTAKSAKKAADATHTLGIDELNIVKDNNAGSGGADGGLSGGGFTKEAFDKEDIGKFGELATKLKELWDALAPFREGVGQGLVQWFKDLGDSDMMTVVINGLNGLIDFINRMPAEDLNNIGKALTNISNPLGIIGALLDPEDASWYANFRWFDFGDGITSMFSDGFLSGLAGFGASILSFFVDIVGDFKTYLLDPVLENLGGFGEWLSTSLDNQLNFIKVIIGILVDFYSGNVEKAKEKTQKILEIIKSFFKEKLDWMLMFIKIIVDDIWNKIKVFLSIFVSESDSVKTLISNIWDRIKDRVLLSVGKFISFFVEKIGVAKGTASAFSTSMSTLINNLIKLAKDKVTEWVTKFAEKLNEAKIKFSTFKEGIRTMFENLKELIVGKIEKLPEKIKETANKALNQVGGFINKIIELVNGLLDKIQSINIAGTIAGKVGEALGLDGLSFSFGSIPKLQTVSIPQLAQGAVLPPNSPFLAMVGDQRQGTNIEAPLSTIQEAVASVMEPYLQEIARNTRITANKDWNVNIGDRDVAKSNVRGTTSLGRTIVI